MWHHSFDPHTQVPQLEEASLKPVPNMIRSPNVNNFLANSSMPALVQSAMAKVKCDEEMKEQEEEIT